MSLRRQKPPIKGGLAPEEEEEEEEEEKEKEEEEELFIHSVHNRFKTLNISFTSKHRLRLYLRLSEN